MKTLIIAPHWDDEAISCGGLIQQRTHQGHEVGVLYVHERNYEYRGPTEEESAEELRDMQAAKRELGYQHVFSCEFPEGEPQKVGFYRLLQRIEELLKVYEPDEVVIPGASDLNQDHRHLNHVMKIALRPINLGKVFRVLEFCALDGIVHSPNFFVAMDALQLSTKIRAVAAYRKESRTRGPRAPHVIGAQAQVWGAMIGVEYAEGFNLILERRYAGSDHGREWVHRNEPDAVSGADGA